MDIPLQDILRCPVCKEPLAHADAVLTCGKHHRYPVFEGIPRLYRGSPKDFPAAASPPDSGQARLSPRYKTTQRSYADWWLKFRSEWMYEWPNKEILINRTGLTPADVAGRRLLDAGTGNGRFIRHLAAMGAAEIAAMDLGRGVEKARDLNKDIPQARFVQGNLLEPPFATASFDGVLSIGVLHHTPDPRGAFARLAALVKPDGFISVFLYYKRWRPYDRDYVEFLRDAKSLLYLEPLRYLIHLLPHRLIVAFLNALYVKRRLIAWLEGRQATRWLGRLVDALTPPDTYLKNESRARNVANNYDGYSTRYRYQISLEEALQWVREAGLNDVQISPFSLSLTAWRRQEGPDAPLRITYHRPRPVSQLGRWPSPRSTE